MTRRIKNRHHATNAVSDASAPFALDEVLDLVRAMFTATADTKGLQLTVSPSPVSMPLLGDAQRLSQVLVNLVGNAVKFTSEGSVTLSVSAVPSEAGTVHLRFEVRDTGPGIPPEKRAMVFEPFVQAGAATGTSQGVGLGLAITKRLLDLMGASISLDCDVDGRNGGTCVCFELSLPVANETARIPRRSETATGLLPGLRVLVAEDDETNRFVLEAMLTASGCKVQCVNDGAALMPLLHGTAPLPDVLLLDMEMPEMDGLTVLRRIRELPALSALPVLVISGNVLKSKKDAAIMAGARAFLAKPYTQAELLQAISAVTDRPMVPLSDSLIDDPAMQLTARRRFLREYADAANQLATSEPTQAQFMLHRMQGAAAILGFDLLASLLKDMEESLTEGGLQAADLDALGAEIARLERAWTLPRLLLVDDCPEVMSALSKRLSREYTVFCATTGAAAIDLALSENPDLILTDMFLPDMKGTELCATLRANPATAQSPVVFLSGADNESQLKDALAVGGEAYLCKPVSPQQLLTAIETHRRR